jgi:DNA polymerase-3 subunit gamma/tau
MAEQYLVSARKYRPQTFDTVVGQEHITTTLKNAIRTNHLAHAYLFCGPRGVGKTTCARILARTINCETPTADMEACGHCATCQSFNNNTSFNVFELDAASNNSVDDIRELVNQVRFAPQQGRYKIYIIDEVHMLSASAFNAFLKTLEEPPSYAIFILATTEKHKILPTILSRCQIFDFKRINTSDTVAHLQTIATREHLQAEEAALHVIAQKSEGCMRDSLSMLDRIASFTGGNITYTSTMEHLAMLDADFYFRLTDSLLAQDVSSALLYLDNVLEKGFEGNVVLEGLAEHFRNLLLCKDARMAKLLDVPAQHKKMYFEKAQQAPPSFVLSALNVLNDSELNYRNASNRRLHTELCLIRLCYLLQTTRGLQPALGGPLGNAVAAETTQSYQPVSAASLPNPAPVATSTPTTPSAPAPKIQQAPTAQAPIPASPPVAPTGQQTTASPSETASRPQPATDNRRLRAGVLKDLDSALAQVNTNQVSARTLTSEEVESLFDKFRENIRQGGRSALHAQTLAMKAECVAADEVRIVSPASITDSYAQNLRNDLIEYFSKEVGGNVRVTTELREDASAQQSTQVLSKQEIYEQMAAKNPLIAQLREGLNMQIDY